MGNVSKADTKYLQRCLDLAKQGNGLTSPNPLVGAIVVKNGRVIAEGFHQRCGGPHAEIIALSKADKSAAGAVLYVNLEPCVHTGRTPPCTDAIIASGVRRVVVGMKDPNPLTNGKGITRLRRAGVRVDIPADQAPFKYVNRVFIKYIRTGLPYVIVKTGQSLDGKIATRSGNSQWITGATARSRVHLLRGWVDAVMVGSTTVTRDNPRLTCRGGKRLRDHKPVKVIVDPDLRISAHARLFGKNSPAPVYVAAAKTENTSAAKRLKRAGARIVRCPVAAEGGRLDLRFLLLQLAAQDISSIMVEGGGELIGSFFDAQLVDEVWMFIAPKIIGGLEATPAVGGGGIKKLSQAPAVTVINIEQLGRDILIQGRISYPRSNKRKV